MIFQCSMKGVLKIYLPGASRYPEQNVEYYRGLKKLRILLFESKENLHLFTPSQYVPLTMRNVKMVLTKYFGGRWFKNAHLSFFREVMLPVMWMILKILKAAQIRWFKKKSFPRIAKFMSRKNYPFNLNN